MLVSEFSGSDVVSFSAVTLEPGSHLLPVVPNPSRRRLEIIGDSDTVGFSIDGPYPGDSSRELQCLSPYSWTNTRMAWGASVAALLGAEAHLIAKSGIGVVENAVHWLPPGQTTMPEAYERSTPGRSGLWEAKRFVPDAVLMLIGANDFVNLFKPSNASFVAGYVKFLKQVRGFHSLVPHLPLIQLCAASGGTVRGNPVTCPLLEQASR